MKKNLIIVLVLCVTVAALVTILVLFGVNNSQPSSLSIVKRMKPTRKISRSEFLNAWHAQDRILFFRDQSAPGASRWRQRTTKEVANLFKQHKIAMRLMVTPTGVVGWYDARLVETHIDLTTKTIIGQAKKEMTANSNIDGTPFRLQHIQHDYDPDNLDFYIRGDTNQNKTQYYITPSERYYFRTLESAQFLDLLRDAVPDSVPLDSSTLDNINFYISGQGIITNLHLDQRSGMIVQIKGKKRVYVFPQSQLQHCDFYHQHHPLTRRSRIDTKLTEELIQSTSLRHARGYEVILEPGTMLYIPSNWPHYVETLEPETYSIILRFRH